MMNTTHTHTPSCLAGNELSELCCIDLAREQLAASCRRTVLVGNDTSPNAILVPTFTDDDDDAIALVRTDLDAHHTPMRVVFVDHTDVYNPYA